ncbi:MAG TPA: squalene synthase HpnC [Burkholderiaceae bacterium]
MPVDHYENFPVASILLPARLRPAVEAIYNFARSADDIADEGDAAPEDRLAALSAYEAALDRIEQGKPAESRLFHELGTVIAAYALPLQPFRDLLSAFKQDVTTKRYVDFALLLDYCRRSANPVGTLMLHLYKAATPDNLRDSDAICSALQMINFWQDVAVDWQKQRIYLPQEDLRSFNFAENDLSLHRVTGEFRDLLRFEAARSREMMESGAPLAKRLPGRVGWELRLVVQGGLRILERIEAVGFDVFQRRPKLGPSDWLVMLWRAIRM